MKKICFFINNVSNSGGTEKITILTANYLAKSGFDVTILTIEPFIESFFKINSNVSVETLGIARKGNIKRRLKIGYAVNKFISMKGFEFFVAVDSLIFIYLLQSILSRRCKFICWEHFNFNINLGVRLRTVSRCLASVLADRIIVLTERDKERWKTFLPWCKNKIKVFYNTSSYPVSKNIYDVKNKVVLAVGRLTHQKGFDLLIDAWSEIAKQHCDWKLIIVGYGDSHSALQDKIIDLNVDSQVEIIPPTLAINEYFSTAGVFCMSSRFEGLPLVLIEAQAFGLPTVAFDCDCGPSEVITEDSGYVVPFGDVSAFSKSLSTLLSNDTLRLKMSKSTRENATQFTTEAYLNRWLQMLSEK